VVPRLVSFINDLANWYVRLNRARFKGHDGDAAERAALRTLARVLQTIVVAMAPFTPFFSEHLYQNLRHLLPVAEREDSVHYLSYPEPDTSLDDATLERQVALMQVVIELGRLARERRRRALKQPLAEVIVYARNAEQAQDLRALQSYILDELNVRTLTLREDATGAAIALRAAPDSKRLGQRLRGDRRKVEEALAKLPSSALEAFEASGELRVEGHVLTREDMTLVREFTGDSSTWEAAWNENVLVVLHVSPDENLELEGHMREVQNRVQRLRKAAGLLANDTRAVTVYWSLSHAQSREAAASADAVRRAIAIHLAVLQKKTRSVLVDGVVPSSSSPVLLQSTSKVNSVDFSVALVVALH
jgi:isoleucyl-tRNA synthetase